EELVARLITEGRVPFDVPRQEPVRVADGHQAAGDDVPVPPERVPLADLLDVGRDLVVEGPQAGRYIGALVREGAELVGPTEGRVLCSNVAPHRPDAALADLPVPFGRGVVVPPRGALDGGAVSDENEVVLGDVDSSALSAAEPFDHASDHALGLDVELGADVERDIGHPRVVLDLDALLLQPFD